MRKFLLAVVAVITTTVCEPSVYAQQKVYLAQTPTITMGGHFNNGSGDTSLKSTWTSAQIPFYCRLDTTTSTAAANDSVYCRLVGNYSTVSIEIRATRVAGRCDSTTFYVWGSKWGETSAAAGKLLTSFTMANNANEQRFQYDFNSGANAWPYTGFRVTCLNTNAHPSSSSQWQAKLLVR